jgi:hypothetical protein
MYKPRNLHETTPAATTPAAKTPDTLWSGTRGGHAIRKNVLFICALFASAICLSNLAHAATPTPTETTPAQAPIANGRESANSKESTNGKESAVATVEIESTISGNVEQPKTIYVMPWQEPIASIKLPAPELALPEPALQPLDREQFLQFMQAQPAAVMPSAETGSSADGAE